MTTVVFMGSPDFSLPTLGALSQAYEVVGVVSQPDRASGRGRELKAPPVKMLALELGIPVMQPEKLRQPEAMEQLRPWNPDLIVVAAFGQILRREVMELPTHGCINVHASLLPRWRGAAPINAAILHGDQETGVTIMVMDVGLDTGPMLSKRSIRLTQDETAGSAFEKLSRLGADLLIETLPAGMTVTQYLQTRIWDPLGMEYDGSWSTDSKSSDFEKMETGVNARAIDFAKFGVLYLNGGNWNGTLILPEAWVDESTQPLLPENYSDYYTDYVKAMPGQGYYNYMWWGMVRDDGTYDFTAEGDKGQFIYVSPENNMVIVRNGIRYGISSHEWLKIFSEFSSQY